MHAARNGKKYPGREEFRPARLPVFFFFSFYRRVIEIFRLVGGERADRLFNSVR